MKEMVDLDHSSHLELVQKAKIQWSIEGDENSGFFSKEFLIVGVNNLPFVGVMIDGVW